MTLVLFPGARLEVPFADPLIGVLNQRHLARLRVQPLTAEQLRLRLHQPLLRGSLGVERVRRLPRHPIRPGVASLPPPGPQLPNTSEPALPSLGVATHHATCRSRRTRRTGATVHESM